MSSEESSASKPSLLEDTWLVMKNAMDRMLHSSGDIDGQQEEGLRSAVRELSQSDNKGLLHQDGSAEGPPPAKRARQSIAEMLRAKLKNYLEARVADMKRAANDKAGNELLEFFHTNCTRYSTVVHAISCHPSMFSPDDTWRLAADTWRRYGIRPTSRPVMSALLSEIARERQGEKVASTILAKLITCARRIDRNFYSEFKKNYCRHIAQFYGDKYTASKQDNSIASYAEFLAAVEQWLEVEEAMCRRYMSSDIFAYDEGIEAFTSSLMLKSDFRSKFPAMLRADNADGLARMYRLCIRTPLEVWPEVSLVDHCLAREFRAFVTDRGLDAVKSVSSSADGRDAAKLYVDAILGVHRKYYNLVLQAFSMDDSFTKALEQACSNFVNQLDHQVQAMGSRQMPELLARYFDALLKKEPEHTASAQLSQDNGVGSDQQLNEILTILGFIRDKNLFRKYYTCFLGRRLLFDQSTSLDTEAAVLLGMHKKQGYEYTFNMERMLHSVNTSRELNSSFQAFMHKSKEVPPGLDFKIKVLPAQAWSIHVSRDSGVSIPYELEKCYTAFDRFYKKTHEGRKLQYSYNYCRGELITNFTKNRYTLQVSTYQIAVLMMFNTETCYTVQEIAGATSIEPQVLQQVLAILVKAKLLLPTTEPEAGGSSADSGNSSKLLAPGSRLTLNQDFKNKRLRINLNSKHWIERAA